MADNFLWKNYTKSTYYDWDDAASWYVGIDYDETNCVAATRAPGENDTIAYSVKLKGAYATGEKFYANLGGKTVTIKGFTDPHTSWQSVTMSFTNGTLCITDVYGAQMPHITFEHANFIAPVGSGKSDNGSWLGASGVRQEFYFKYGSTGEFYGDYEVFGARIYVDSTSTLVFKPTIFQWRNPQGGRHGIFNCGTASFPNGLVMGSPNSSLQAGHTRYFDVTNEVGAVMNITGDVAANFPAQKAGNESYFDFYAMGGTINFDGTPTFKDIGCHFGDGSAIALNVTDGNILDITSFAGGTGTAITKGGAGAVRVPATADYTLAVAEGALCVTDAETPIPSFVTLTSKLIRLETCDIEAEKLSGTTGTIDLDLTKMRDGVPIVKSSDSELLESFRARFPAVGGMTFVIREGGIYPSVRTTPVTSTWTGAAGDGKWTTLGNWSGDVPGRFTNSVGGVCGSLSDSAIFPAIAAESATIDLTGCIIISNVTVRGTTAYTFGSSADQTLRIIQGGCLTVASDVTHDVVLTAKLALGWEMGEVVRLFTLSNASTAATLVVNDFGYFHGTSSWKADQVWLEGVGNIRFAAAGPNSLAGHAIQFWDNVEYDTAAKTGKVIIDKKLTLHSVNSYYGGTRDSWRCVEIGAGGNLDFSGGSTTVGISADRKLLFTGDGKITFESTAGKGDTSIMIDNVAVFECEIASSGGSKGLRLTKGGQHTIKGVNSMEGMISSLSAGYLNVGTIGTVGEQSDLGFNDRFRLGLGARLRYTGPGETATKILCISSGVARIVHAGTGPLVMNSSPVTEQTGTTLSLRNESASTATWAGALTDNPHSYDLLLEGGAWTLTGANTFTGKTTLDSGTLTLSGAGTLATSSEVILKDGTTLAFDQSGTATLQKLVLTNGTSTVRLTGTSLTIAAIDHAADTSVNIVTEGDAASVTVTGMTSATTVGSWLTINGRQAGFDDSGKVIKRLIPIDTQIAAKGGVIPNDATKNVGITTVGSEGHVTLENSDSAAVAALAQMTTVKAEVEIPAGKTFTTGGLYVDSEAADLQIGGFENDGTLAAGGSTLTLYPEGATNDLTILAPVSIAATTVAKDGEGTARIAGANFGTWAGTLQLNRGTFALSNATQLAATLKGSATFAKEGAATTTLSKAQTSFKGDFVVAGGEVQPTGQNVFGSTDGGANGRTVVKAGARVDLTAQNTSDSSTVTYGYRPFVIAGDGGDGKGALRGTALRSVNMGPISLSDDATVTTPGGSRYFHQRSGIADFGGHTLTKTGDGCLTYNGVTITNAGEIVIADTAGATKSGLVLYDNTDLGESDKPITLGNGSVIYLGTSFKPGSKPFTRPLIVTGTNAALNTWATGLITNRNVWAGPIELKTADSCLVACPWNTHNDAVVGIFGKISGPGSLYLYNHGKELIANPANDFTGTVRVRNENNNSAIFLYPGSLPDPAKLTVDMGRVTVVTEGEEGEGGYWKKTDILNAVNKATFKSSNDGVPRGVIAIDARTAPDSTYELSVDQSEIGDGSNFSIGADGGRVVLSGGFTAAHDFAAHAGTLAVSGNVTRTVESVFASSDGSNACGTVSFEGGSKTLVTSCVYAGMMGWGLDYSGNIRVANATVEAETLLETGAISSIRLGLRQHTGVLDVEEGASVRMGLQVGYHSTGSRGAVYMRGGSLTAWATTSQPVQFAAGLNSYGFLGLEGGDYVQHGFATLNATGKETRNSQGLVYQSGGTFRHDKLGHEEGAYMWRIGGSADSVTAVYRTGGTMKVDGQIILINESEGLTNGVVQWTQGAGCGRAECDYQTILAANTNAQVVLNLNGGTYATKEIYKYAPMTGNKAYVNFDGGELEIKGDTAVFGSTASETKAPVDRVTVFGGGAKIAVISNKTATLEVALQKPEGSGITAIALPDFRLANGNRLIGPPAVKIVDEGGAGYGASAVVTYDRLTERATGVVITSPGCNYTNPKAIFTYATNDWTAACTAGGAETSGGFAKTGDGTLVLNAANTYEGATTVEDGTLKVGVEGAIPEGSPLILKGGLFDPNGFTFDLTGATFAGGGVKGDVTLPTAFSVDFDRALAGKPMTIEGVATIQDGSAFTVSNFEAEKLASLRKVTLFQATENVVGPENLTVSGIDESALPENWVLEKFEDGRTIRLHYRTGLMMLLR